MYKNISRKHSTV